MVADILIALALVLSVYIWRIERSKLSFYNLVFFVVVIAFAAWEYVAQDILHLPKTVLSRDISSIFWIAAGVVLIVIMVKFFRRK